MKPVCFIHIGTNKTGTTAIQIALAKINSDTIFVPKTGRPTKEIAAHHNIINELNGNLNFRPEYGTLKDLLDELSLKRPNIAVISSESFGHIYTRPLLLEYLKDSLASIGYDSRIVLYVRPQTEHIPLQYAELVKHGFTISFVDFFSSILKNGIFIWKNNRSFCFEYSILADSFARVFGKNNIIIRPYQDSPDPTFLIKDFLSILQQPISKQNEQCFADIGRPNEDLSFLNVINIYYENLQKTKIVNPDPLSLAKEVLSQDKIDAIHHKFNPLDQGDIQEIRQRFKEDNERLFSLYGVDLTQSSQPAPFGKLQKQVLLATKKYWGQ